MTNVCTSFFNTAVYLKTLKNKSFLKTWKNEKWAEAYREAKRQL